MDFGILESQDPKIITKKTFLISKIGTLTHIQICNIEEMDIKAIETIETHGRLKRFRGLRRNMMKVLSLKSKKTQYRLDIFNTY